MQQRLAALAQMAQVQVVAPSPVLPFIHLLRKRCLPNAENWNGLTVHRPTFSYIPAVTASLGSRLYARGIRKWLEGLRRQWLPDILDAHFIWPDGVAVSLLARQMEIPYAITLRGKIYPCLEIASQRRQCREALQNAAAVISVSQDMADVARVLGVLPDRLHVVPNGVDTERFKPRDKTAARRELGLPEHGRLILTVAHLGLRKGHAETIQALATLPQDVRLILVGGSLGSRDQRILRTIIARLGLTNRVIFAGPQSYDRIPLYFNAADASILASYREGCPNVVLESLASGTPVVATQVGAVPDLIQDRRDGRIIAPKDTEATAQALADVLEKPWSSQQLSQSPAVRSWTVIAGQLRNVLAEAISRPERHRSK